MPIDYKLRNLRRLFGEPNFLRPAQSGSGGSGGRGAAAAAESKGREDARSGERRRRPKPPGGVPRAFFSEQPPRAMKNKAVGGQLFSVFLFEKQKMKLYYGAMSDGKFKRYVREARSKRYNVDAALLRMLELRLDTFLYRTGFVHTPPQGRQWINHNQILINGRPVNIKSYQMRPGDVLNVRERHVEHALTSSRQAAEARASFGCGASWILSSPDPAGMLPWMEIDRVGLSAVLVREPTDEEARSLARAALFPYIRDANLNPLAAMRAYR